MTYEEALKHIKSRLKLSGAEDDVTLHRAIETLEKQILTTDAEEVKHGKWVLVKPRRNGRNATYKCTVCNQLYSSYYNDVQEWTHCPCGAKMDKE